MTETAERPVDAGGSRKGGRLTTLVSGAGQTLITVGLVLLLFVAYELWGTGRYTAHAQHTLEKSLAVTWQGIEPDPHFHLQAPRYDPVPQGQGVAVLYIPALGRHYHYVVVQGVGEADLRKGPGHYPGTALPGQVGNLVVSGHRTTYLAPFNRIDELRPGDNVVFETARGWFVYRVSDVAAYHLHYQQVVDPSDVGEAWPVPNHRGARATRKIFTFTTCNPKYSARQRLIVHGVFVRAVAKPGVAPPEIARARS